MNNSSLLNYDIQGSVDFLETANYEEKNSFEPAAQMKRPVKRKKKITDQAVTTKQHLISLPFKDKLKLDRLITNEKRNGEKSCLISKIDKIVSEFKISSIPVEIEFSEYNKKKERDRVMISEQAATIIEDLVLLLRERGIRITAPKLLSFMINTSIN